MIDQERRASPQSTKARWENNLSTGLAWPIERASLAALIDVGLTAIQIGRYFSVSGEDVHFLCNRYGLSSSSECRLDE